MDEKRSETEELFIGKTIKFFLKSNNYKYQGKCLGISNTHVIFLDNVTGLKSMQPLSDIKDLVEVLQ